MAKQAVWALFVLAALLVGFTGGTFLSGQQGTLADFENRLAALEKQLGGKTAPSSSVSQRTAVVKVNELLLRYQAQNPTIEEEFRKGLAQIAPEMERLNQQLKRGEISQEEASTRAFELQNAVRQRLVESMARPIQDAINQIAQEKGYDIVLKREDVVLYYRGTTFDDITEQVWSRVQSAK